MEDCNPKDKEEAARWVETALRFLAQGSKERAEEVKELAPLRTMLTYIASEVEADRASLLPSEGVSGNAIRIGSARGEIVGWWSRVGKKRMMHLNEATTYGWYIERMKRQGKDVTFSWSAMLREAKNEYGAREHRLRIGRHKRQVRLVSMPLKLLNLGKEVRK